VERPIDRLSEQHSHTSVHLAHQGMNHLRAPAADQFPDTGVIGIVAPPRCLERIFPRKPFLRNGLGVVHHDAHRCRKLEGQHFQPEKLVKRELDSSRYGMEGADGF
jgi:hypothetical protein